MLTALDERGGAGPGLGDIERQGLGMLWHWAWGHHDTELGDIVTQGLTLLHRAWGLQGTGLG